MTQESREATTEEPQVHLEEAGAQNDATDEDRIADTVEADKLVDEGEASGAAEEDTEVEGGDGAEADDAVTSETPEEEVDETVDEEPVAIEAPEEEFEEDPPRPLDEDEELEDIVAETSERDEEPDVTEDGAEGSEEPEDSAESGVAEEDGNEAEEEQNQAEETEEETPTVESVIEAILFATDEPLTENRLANIVETTNKQVRQCIKDLNEKYEKNHNAFRIEQIAGGHQMLTLSTYNTWLRRMLRVRSDNRLSPAAMETLAIVAYKQPVIRVDIEAIRGVAVGEVIRSLMYKGLVKIVGRAEILGRPMLYGTTKKFLEVFGLNSLKDLPKVEELKKPD
ncbi:MAG: SMC-Scp complex subunit ScpB [Phycisphaerales bacterium]|nr:MAG: SMC-Scp complex subunit ScpB [Phycisphaerales bacterium]